MDTEYSSIPANATRAQFVGRSPACRACLGLSSAIAAEHDTARERERGRGRKKDFVSSCGGVDKCVGLSGGVY